MSAIKKYLRMYRTFLVFEGVLILLAVVMEIGSRTWPSDFWRVGLILFAALAVSTLTVHILALIAHRFVAQRFKRKFMFASQLIIFAGLIYWLVFIFNSGVSGQTETSVFVTVLAMLFAFSMSNYMYPERGPLDGSPQ